MGKSEVNEMVDAIYWCTHKQVEDILQIAVENLPASHVDEIKRIIASVYSGKRYDELTEKEVVDYTRSFNTESMPEEQ